MERRAYLFLSAMMALSAVILAAAGRFAPEMTADTSGYLDLSVTYGLGVLGTSMKFRLARLGFERGTIFEGLSRVPPT